MTDLVRSSPPLPTSGPEEEIEIRRLWHVLVRNRWLVLGIAALTVGAVAVFLAFDTPTYESEATVRIDKEEPGLDLLEGVLPAGLGAMAGLNGGDEIQTDIAVLKSRRVAEAVVDSLALRVVLLDSESPRQDVLRVLRVSRGKQDGIYHLHRRDDGSYTLRVESGDKPSEIARRVALGRPFRIGEVVLALNPALRNDPPQDIRLEINPFRATVEQVQKNLRITRPSSGAQIVGIKFRHTDPVLAAAVPNVVTESFFRYKNRVSSAESRSTIDFLQEQSAAYAADLREAEAKVRGFREQAQIVEPRVQATEQVRRLAELQSNRDELEAERESLGKLLARIDEEPARASGRSPYRQLAAFPTFISNGAVQNIQESLNELETQRAELLVRRTPQSVDVQGIDQRIGELEMQLYEMARSYLEGLDNQIAALDGISADFGAELDQVPSREVELLRLLREQKLLEGVYTLIQTKLKEAQIKAAAHPAGVQVIDAALVPDTPASPKPVLYLLGATVLGLVIGAGGAFAREYSVARIHTRQDVAAATSGLSVLGIIPRTRVRPSSNGSGVAITGGRLRLSAAHRSDWHLVMRDDPWNPASEAYRALRTNLILSGTDGTPRIVVVTSAVAEDGKSTTSANLAISLAQQGTRTLLIDADLRRSTLHQLFGIPLGPGLREVILGQATLEEAVRPAETGESGVLLHVLAAGAPTPNPAELLGSVTTGDLLHSLRGRYDAVILDAPPLTLFTDAAVLGRKADAVVLVARAGITAKDALQDATDQLHRLHIPISGVVLNESSTDVSSRYSTYSGMGNGAAR